MKLTTINDVIGYVDTIFPGHGLSDDVIHDLFHASDLTYDDWIVMDDGSNDWGIDPRLGVFQDSILNATVTA